MKQFYKYILTLVAVLMVTSNAWGECVIINDPNEYQIMDYKFPAYTGTPKTFTISYPRPAGILTFSYSEGTWPTGGVDVTATYSDNSTEKIISASDNSYNSYDFGRKIVKSLKFEGTGTVDKWIKNIKLTQATYVDAPKVGGAVVTEWNAGSSIVGDNVYASATIDWSNTVFSWELQGNTDNQFSVNFSSTGATCAYGQSTITATYHRTQPGTHSATLKIYTVSGNYTIALNGVTDKYTPLAEKKQDELILNNSYSPSELFKVYYIANNVEQTISDYIITPLTPDIANYVDGKIVTNYRSGEAKFQLTRSGNDSFYALEDTISFNVAASGETCDIPLSQTSFTVKYVNTDGNNNGTFSEIITLPISGCGETLSFYYCVTTNANNDHYLIPQYSPDASGDDWRDLGTRQTYNSTTPKYHSVTIDDAARRIRFKRTGENKSAQRDFNITSVTITRKQFLQATDNDDKALNSGNSLVLPTVMKGSNAANTTFNFKWSACSDIKLACDNSKFTISTTDITTDEGNSTITVSCNTSTEGTFSGTITIYSQEQVVSFPVTCTVNNKWETDVISGQTSQSMLVDGTWTTDFVFPANNASQFPTEGGDFYYTISHDLGDNAHLKEGYTDKVITYKDGVITAHNEGTAVLTIRHKETDSHFASKTEFKCTITVKKHTPTFTWHGQANTVATTEYFNTTYTSFFVSSSTTNNASTTLSYSSSDIDVATLSAGSTAQSLNLTTYNKEASTTLTVKQAENYYWYEKEESKTVTPIDPNNHVPFTIDTQAKRDIFDINWNASPYTWDNGIQMGDWLDGGSWDDKYVDLYFTGIPDKLTFNTSIKNATDLFDVTGVYWYVKESADGVNWSGEIWNEENTKNITITDSIQLNPDTRYVRLCYSGNFGGVFHNVTVTELNEFDAVDINNENTHVTRLDFDSIQVYTEKTMSFALKYANAGYKVKLESTDPSFSIVPEFIDTIGGEYHGTTDSIKVTFYNELEYTVPENARIEITDEHDDHIDYIYLSGNTYKLTQSIDWRDDFKQVEEPILSTKFGTINNAAQATSKLSITYESDNESVIAITDDGKSITPIAEGIATITAYQKGNELYKPSEKISKKFIVTDRIVQVVQWHDYLYDLIIGNEILLTAKVYTQDPTTGELTYSEEQTKKIQYKTEKTEDVVSVQNNLLKAIAIGTTTLTAYVEQDDDYKRAELSLPVRVRSATEGCEDILLLNEPNEHEFYAFDISMPELISPVYTIDHTLGVPGQLSFQHRGASWDLVIQYYKGKIIAQQSLDNEQTWQNIIEITPQKNQTNTTIVDIDRAATHIRFVRPSGGQGYHYVSNIRVFPAQYIEAKKVVTNESEPETEFASEITIDYGQIHVGSVEQRKFILSYSNIKETLVPSLSSTQLKITPNSFGSCGGFNQEEVSIQWTPMEANSNSKEVITFVDHISQKQCIIHLIADVQKGPQHLIGVTDNITITNCNSFDFPTETTADLPVQWEVIEGTDYANFVDGELVLYGSGTIKIKASNDGSSNYEPFEKIYTFYIDFDPTFVGTEDSCWHNPNNWTICRIPYENETIKIQAPATLSTHASVAGVTFTESNGVKGSIYITSTGGLTIGAQGVTNAATDGSSIIIDNLHTDCGFLRIDPAYTGTMPRITMRYQTRSTLDTGANKDATWQYIGAPGANTSFTVDYITWLYHWSETQGWINKTGTLTLEPFAGYAITQYGQPTYELITTPIHSNQTITLTKTDTGQGMKGDNLIANSFTAPINAKKFTESDFTGNVDKTFYIFNSGSWNQWNNKQDSYAPNDGTTKAYSPGQYMAIPALGSQYIDTTYDMTTIPPMQGIYMIAKEDSATITFNYEKHVWNAGATNMNEPMRAPVRDAELYEEDIFKRIRIQVNSANSGADRMYIIQDTINTPNYDNGYDAPNQLADGLANIYTNEHFGQMEVSCSNHIDSMFIGFSAGEDSIYTLTFNALIGDELHIKDVENDSIIPLEEGGKYTFMATPNSKNDLRFQILLYPELEDGFPEVDNNDVITHVSNTSAIQIWAHGKTVYIANAPYNNQATLYNISGQVLLTTTIHSNPYTLDLSHLQEGVYIIKINHTAYKVICQ